MNSTLQLGVVIATLERPVQLRQTLESLTTQIPKTPIEVIVADNGCSELNRDIAEQYRNSFSRLLYVRVPKRGAAAARNAAIAAGSAPIVLFLDDDIVADPGLVSAHLEAHQGADKIAVLGPVRFPWNGTECAFTRALIKHPELFQSFRVPNPDDVSYLHFYTCNLSIKRSSLKCVRAFDESFTASGFEDIDLGYRFAGGGGRLILVQSATALHNVQTSYSAFAAKCYRDGWWLGHLLQKYPELISELNPPRQRVRDVVKTLLGTLGSMVSWVFDWHLAPYGRWTQDPLATLCWHALGVSYRKGYMNYLENSANPEPLRRKNAASVEACGDVSEASGPERQ